MIHELRTYSIFEHNKSAFLQRFEEHAWRIMREHGFEVLAFWESEEEDGPAFVYLLQWTDEAARRAGWDSFMADDAWAAIKAETGAEHGKMVGGIRSHTLKPASFSPGRVG